jgi:hypothetical protein
VLEQELDRSVHVRGLDDVVVVQDQHDLIAARAGGQLVDQHGHQQVERGGRGQAEQRTQPGVETGADPVHRGYRMAPEPGRVVVPAVQ